MVRAGRQQPGESSKAGDSPAHSPLRAERTAAKGSAPAAASLAATSATALNPQALLALQRSAGNAAATRAMGRTPSGGRATGPAAPVQRAPGSALGTIREEADKSADPDAIQEIDENDIPLRPSLTRPAARTGPRRFPVDQRWQPGGPAREPADAETRHVPLELPPYLRNLQSAGLSTAYKLTGHEFVHNQLRESTGQSGGTVAEIKDELAGRPETFYGQGRAFAVQGPEGWYDVTVSITRDHDDVPLAFPHPDARQAGAVADAAKAAVKEGAATKVDHMHSSSGSVTNDSSSSRRIGAVASGTYLGPTPVPAVWVGVTVAAGGYIHSSTDTNTAKTVAEPRVLRSAGGTVEVPRKVRYNVRVKHHGTTGAPETFHGPGTLTMRVPHEHLVPATTRTPDHAPALSTRKAREVRLATSMAPLAVEDTGAPHEGGHGLFDAVASVLHPSLTSPGSAGRARLYEATSTATVLQDLPRLLAQWVPSEDLGSKDGRTQGAYRMRAHIVSMAPAWGTGKTQLRTHQQTHNGRRSTTGKGAGGVAGAGPAMGLGAPVPVVRITAMPMFDAQRTRFTSADQTVSTRQGAEIRGEKVLYRSRVRLTVQGTGPSSPKMRLRPGKRTAEHPLDVWISMRAEEAKALGLPLPDGVTADELYSKTEKNADGTQKLNQDGTPKEMERHLPFGAMGSSVALNHLDAAPLIAGVERLFAENPQLAGYLPAEFGASQPAQPAQPAGNGAAARKAAKVTPQEAEAQRRNYRELVTVLSETNLRANKDQLLSSGIRVRLRRKTTWQARDVQIHVKGRIGGIEYLGDTADWLTRSSSGVSSSGQSGRSTARGIGVRGAAQGTILPRTLSAGFSAEGHLRSSRRIQAGPTTRTDSLNSGATDTSSFGTTLNFAVDVTMTTRERTAKRALTPGSSGRDEAKFKQIASSADAAKDSPLDLGAQDVKLTTPTALTVNGDTKERLEDRPGQEETLPPQSFPTAGIGALTSGETLPGAESALREWDFVEVVDGQPIRNLAFRVLSQAARRNHATKTDSAFETEGLAPRLAIEEQLSQQAITAALRQGVTSSWVVTNLRYPRRLAALTGAVGTRFALTSPHVMPGATGAGMENMALGGQQVAGERGKAKTESASVNGAGTEHGPNWSLGESVAPHRARTTTTTETAVLSGTVERNAVTPRDKPLFLVQCDLVVGMVAEVKVNARGPYVASAVQTLPGAVSVWLTEEQLKAAGLKDPDAAPESSEKAKGKQPATAAADAAGPSHDRRTTDGPETAGGSAAGAARPLPLTLAQGLPLGVGLIENLPNFVPLLGKLRDRIRNKDESLAKELLPQQQLSDPNDNVQRLLRVLDRDGATGLLAGAMDGGVPVELFRGHKTPYWAVFHVDRTGPGTVMGPTSGREMEYATVAVAQNTTTRAESDASGIDTSMTATGQPNDSAIGSAGGTAGVGLGKSASTKQAVAERGQIGLRTIVDGSAPAVKVNVPIEASLKLYSADGEVASVKLGGTDQHLVYRALDKDLRALRQLRPVHGNRAPGQNLWSPVAGAAPEKLRTWRETGAQLPMSAQVNGFRGAPELQAAIRRTVTDAQASEKFHSKGNAAAYAQREAVSTEWLIAALPLLVSAGAELPANHASGLEGQDLRCSLHARLFDGHVLEALDDKGDRLEGDEMTFETLAQSTLDAPRPAARGHQQSASHGTSVSPSGGEGPVRADYSGMNNVVGTGNLAGSATSSADNGSGTVPLQKPRDKSVLVQFTLEFRIVARVRHRHTQRVRSASGSTSVRDYVLPSPVVIRMPERAVQEMLKGTRNGGLGRHRPSAEAP